MTMTPKDGETAAKNPLVSVIIIFLNGEVYLEAAIQSVFAQTYAAWELLLVDDGSNDGSGLIARRWAAEHPRRVRYLEHPNHENRGMSAARNLGIHHAQGIYVAFLDADDIWLPQKLAHQVQIMESQPAAGMVYGNTLYWHSWAGTATSEADFLPDLGVPTDRLYPPGALLPLFLNGRAAVPCTCALLVRRSALRRCGGFVEQFRSMYEDQAFYAKICLAEPIFVSAACHDWYRQHAASTVAQSQQRGWHQQARRRFLDWLTAYLLAQKITDPALLRVVRQESWLLRPIPWLPAPLAGHSRRIRKWLLQFSKWVTQQSATPRRRK